MRRRRRAAIAVGAILLALSGEARGQDAGPIDPEPGFESWIVIEEEVAPEPALLRLDLGFVAWTSARSRIRADRNQVPGTRLNDLEELQGLDSSGLAPWIELSIGTKVRSRNTLFTSGL